MTRRLLLGSGGLRTPERLETWKRDVDAFCGGAKNVLFIPYALADHDEYLKLMNERGLGGSRQLAGIHRASDPVKAIETADAVFVGGGNSFRLLDALYRHRLLEPIRARVKAGMPYIGISAGTNMACPTLKTTNDMPIVQPPSFEALGLIDFQINPHYFSGAFFFQTGAGMTPYAGETRDDRINEFHEMNDVPVLGLWEGATLKVEEDTFTVAGAAGARLFKKGRPPQDIPVGTVLEGV